MRLLLIIIALWLFAAIAGFSPSVSRAAFMFSVIQIGYTLRKPPEIYNNIAFSAFFLLLINPYQIADVGFQFSYLAVIGIVFFQPRLYNLLYIKNKLIDKIWQLITVSFAAQLATAPLAIHYFHYFPAYFWLTNIFVIPIVGIIIYMAVFLIAAFYIHLPYLLIGKILFYILKIQNFLIFKIQSLPHAMIESLDISFIQIVIYFSLLIFLSAFIINKRHFFLHISLILVIAYLSVHTFNIIKFENQKKMIVFNIRDKTVISIVIGRSAIFISDYDESAVMSDIYQVKNFLIKSGIRRIHNYNIRTTDSSFSNSFVYKKTANNIFFGTGRFKGVFITNPEICNKTYTNKMNLDCIILANNVNINPEKLNSCFSSGFLILDSTNNKRYRAGWLSNENSSKLNIHSVSDNNACVINYD